MPGERTIDFMDDRIKLRADLNALPRLYHLAEGSGTRPLLSIPGEQISSLYAFILHPGGAGHTLHGRLRQSLRPLLSISEAQISMLHSRLYHPSRGSRSYTYGRLSRLSRQGLYVYYGLPALPPHQTLETPETPQKNAQKSVPPDQNMSKSQPQCRTKAGIIHLRGADLNASPTP